EEEHQRLAVGRPAEEAPDSIEEPEPRVLGVLRAGVPADAEALAHHRNDLRHLVRRRAELVAQRVRIPDLRVAAEGLPPRPVRRRAALLGAAPPEDPLVGNAGATDELLDRARLADATLAGDEDETAVSRGSGIEAGPEDGELRFPADEDVRVARESH